MFKAMVKEAHPTSRHGSDVCDSRTAASLIDRLGANRESTRRSETPTERRTASTVATSTACDAESLGDRCLILVVEDEPAVRELAAEVLRAEGFDVLTAENGQEGLDVAQRHSGPSLALVVTDIVMPRMDGITMAEWLRASFPELKILFTSGYSDEVIAQHGELGSDAQFLPKPYSPLRLIATVREMLSGANTTADPARPRSSIR